MLHVALKLQLVIPVHTRYDGVRQTERARTAAQKFCQSLKRISTCSNSLRTCKSDEGKQGFLAVPAPRDLLLKSNIAVQ